MGRCWSGLCYYTTAEGQKKAQNKFTPFHAITSSRQQGCEEILHLVDQGYVQNPS